MDQLTCGGLGQHLISGIEAPGFDGRARKAGGYPMGHRFVDRHGLAALEQGVNIDVGRGSL